MTNEVEEYRTLAERRREEIEALHVDFKRLTEQLAEANAAKCEALVRSEDIGNVFSLLLTSFPLIEPGF